MRRELADGLVLRSAARGDGVELADFNSRMHADVDMPASRIAEWTLDLFDVPHPTFRAERDVTVVEDPATGRIVSAVFLIPQTWSYAGVPVPVAQVELVATDPAYRRRGLIRAQFDVVHEWSDAAGHLIQVISGIAWYYRQFGYTYALDLHPRPVRWLSEKPPASSDGLALRSATPADVGFLAELESAQASGTLLGAIRGADGFELEMARRAGGLLACELLILESPAAGPIGYVAHQRELRDGLVSVRAFELRRGESWLAPTAAVVAHMDGWVRAHPNGPGRGIRFALPDGHAAMRCASTQLGWESPGSYGLYLRMPDLAALLLGVGPALEARLATSPAVGWTGDLHVSLYTEGVLLAFVEGRLRTVERWRPPDDDSSGNVTDAYLPVEAFVNLVLGNRQIDDLERTIADCILATDAGALLLDVLFPPMPLSIWEFC